jgi:hypothetical protein
MWKPQRKLKTKQKKKQKSKNSVISNIKGWFSKKKKKKPPIYPKKNR